MRATLYTADWIVPVAAPPVAGAGMLVDDGGRIERIAPADSFKASDNVRRVDFGRAAILPGLINVHAHPELAAFRGLLDDLPFHAWIPTLMRCKRGAQPTAEEYGIAARWTCVESLRAGITTLGATEDSGAAVGALDDAGMRGLVYLEAFGPASDQADDAIAALHDKIEVHRAAESSRVRIGISPHAPYTVSDALYARVAELAMREGYKVATHAAEAEPEELLVCNAEGPFAGGLRTRGIEVSPRGRSIIDMLARTGLLDCAPLLIHAVRVSPADLQMIAAAGASIAHCPIANARLGHGIAPIVEAMEVGIPVGIGTDSVASNNRLDLLEEAHVAQMLQRARLRSASALPSSDLLRMVTIDSARILGMDDRIGSLESGKDADFCVVRLDSAHTIPVAGVLDGLFHSARGSDVVLTAVAGRALFENGRVGTLDEAALGSAVNALARRLYAARQQA